MINWIKKHEIFLIGIIFLVATGIYLFPIFQGLILLPLDLLVSNYHPWYSPGTILLKNNYMQDSIIQMFPWRHLVYESFTSGVIPFWNPYQFMGAPFLASMKPLVFYPANILFVFGEVTSWNMLLFLQIFLSLFFFYLLAKEFKLTVLPAILSSFAFGLSSLMIGVLEFGSEGHVILWIPLFLFFAKRYLDENKGKNLFFLGICVSLSVFAGQLQYSGYGLILLTLFIFFYGYYKKINKIKYLILFLAIFFGIGLTSVMLLPAFELFKNSHRGIINSSDVFNTGLMNPVLLLRLFSADFFGSPAVRNLSMGYIETSGYIGIVPLFFTFFAIIFARKNIFVSFFSFIFIIATLFSLKFIGSIIYFLKIPLITSGNGGRIFMLVLFSAALLCGFGLIEFVKSKNNKKLILSLSVFISFFVIAIIFKLLTIGGQQQINEFIRNIKFSLISISAFSIVTVFYLILRKKIKVANMLFTILIVAITFAELFIFGYRFLTFSNTKFLYPETKVVKFVREYSKNSLSRVYGLAQPEIPTLLNLYSVDTYNPLYLEKTANFLQFLQKKQNENLSDDNKYFLTYQERSKEVLDFLGVSLVVGNRDGNPSIDNFLTSKYEVSLQEVYQDDKYKAYLNKDAFPRFYLMYKYEIKNDNDTLLLLSKTLNHFRENVILNEEIPYALKLGTGSAVLIESNVNYQKFKVNTTEPAIFYISDTYYPGWSAKINNDYAKIYKANYNFKAVAVPKGDSVVEFSYMPNNFRIAIVLSLGSLIGIIGLSFLHKKISKHN